MRGNEKRRKTKETERRKETQVRGGAGRSKGRQKGNTHLSWENSVRRDWVVLENGGGGGGDRVEVDGSACE